MYRAIELLRSSKFTVTEVAERVEYDSETAFSKAFKRQMGQSPNRYRKQSVVGQHPVEAFTVQLRPIRQLFAAFRYS